MGKPVIKLKFNEELDRDVVWQFYGAKKICGVNFWKERALKHYPELTDINKQKDERKYLDNYISNYYKENEKEIEVLSRGIIENLD